MHIPGEISKAFSDELFGIISPKEGHKDEIKYDPKKAMKIVFERIFALAEINEIVREIKTILERLGTTNNFIVKTYSIEELVIGVKHYLIAWSTMKDLITNLINICFDLGIHETDLSFGVVMRNKKIKDSNVPNIIRVHQSSINVKYTDKQRNDAIHRGKLLDDEINEFRSRYNRLYSRKYSLLNPEPISDDEFKNEHKKLNAELKDLAESKKREYSEHFERTMALNIELAKELAKVTANAVLNNRI